MRRISKTLAAALAVFLVAVGIAACGGDDGSTDSTSAEANGQAQAGATAPGDAKSASKGKSGDDDAKSAGSAGGGGEGQPDGGSAADFVPKQHSDSGGGSEQFRVKGGDNSVQEFGDEADDPEFEAAATALHNFLDARADGNWSAACEYMSKAMLQSFEKLAEVAKQADDTSCGAILGGLTSPAAKPSMKAEAEKADIGSLRVEGDRSFLIYTAGGDTILAMPMANEDGTWKVASLAGSPIN